MRVDLTIAIICYNQQRFIIEALESVKNQVVKYGHGLKIQLLICDDGSNDNTCINANKWLEKNEYLFSEVTKEYSEKNLGTAKNVAKSFRSAHGKYYLSLAGDDLFADVDVIGHVTKIETKHIICGLFYKFKGNVVVEDKIAMFDRLSSTYYSYSYIKKICKVHNIFPLGCLFSTELINDDVLRFMEQYFVLDDVPKNYKIFENELRIKIDYVDIPFFLYRSSEGQVMSKRSKPHTIYQADKEKFCKYILECENSIFVKYSAWCELKKEKKSYSFFRLFDFLGNWKYFVFLGHYFQVKDRLNQLYKKEEMDIQNRYIIELQNKNERW